MLPEFEKPRDTMLLIISGPAGCGKTTVCERLMEDFNGSIARVITATSREPREGEVHGKDYYFIDPETFEKRIEAGDFYEYAQVHGRYYGVLKEEVLNKFEGKKDLVINIDVQGAATFKNFADNDPHLKGRVGFIFIMPSSKEQLLERLSSRGTDGNEEIQRRMESTYIEIQNWKMYDYILCSRTKDEDYERLRSIYMAEMMKKNRFCKLTK